MSDTWDWLRPLRRRIALKILIFAGIPIICLSFFDMLQLRRRAVAAAEDRLYQMADTERNLIAERLQASAASTKRVAENLSFQKDLAAWLKGGPQAASAEARARRVIESFLEQDILQSAWFLGVDGRALVTAEKNATAPEGLKVIITVHAPGAGIDFSREPFFQTALRKQTFCVQDLAYSETRKQNELIFATPIFDGAQSDGAGVPPLLGVWASVIRPEDTIYPLLKALPPRGKLQPSGSSLIVYDVPSNLEKIGKLIKQLDAQTPQVQIEARLFEVRRNPRKELGMDWSRTLGGESALRYFLGGATDPDNPVTAGQQPFLFNVGGTGPKHMPTTAVLSAAKFDVILRLLNTDTDSELLASPRVVTADGKEATIKIVQQEPIPQFTFNTRTAAFEISGFQYKDIGNILVVTPRINKDNFITLDLAPEVSNIADFRRFSGTPAGGTGGGSGLEANIPVINTRTLNTRVIMRNGDTLAIGGLIETTKANSYTKVPVIGDVPVVGMFFRNRRLDTVKRNLLVFMTPTVIPAGGKTGFEDQAEGLKVEEIYADDPWLPKDNAKPKHWQLPEAKPHKGPSAKKAAPAPKK